MSAEAEEITEEASDADQRALEAAAPIDQTDMDPWEPGPEEPRQSQIQRSKRQLKTMKTVKAQNKLQAEEEDREEEEEEDAVAPLSTQLDVVRAMEKPPIRIIPIQSAEWDKNCESGQIRERQPSLV